MENLVSMKDLSADQIHQILKQTQAFRDGTTSTLNNNYMVSNLFFEPSTRTKMSFEMAERKLKLDILPFDAGFSSTLKGETLYDTVKVLESIGLDVLIIRHEQNNYFEELVGKVKPAIINGGDGTGNHPTQSLLDIYTIWQEFGTLQDKVITIVGDINHSRVARSNADALAKLGAQVRFVCPPEWQGEFEAFNEFDEVIEDSDVLMMLRVQHERHDGKTTFSKEQYHHLYGLTIERERKMKKTGIILHPAPFNRGVEIASELVECDRSRIFKQMENGVYVRMAVIEMILKGRE
ncbi:aspartate carbamoyltransferase catalytic subunit [Psychrobacillus psychrodurans]|jgi:aspartate carbamoyltransferase catalytic subunit|uniref:aspartate carbamoyltransferase catalytic subunit n=1 Tax=Psychrobacillus psychrodurans TaxID=126157 RepID=UPI0008EE5FFC|nr:aspartate carbamoyltransferase catalytic subunit [Psychrobacillus psychrodurans]MCZ8539466.1 aspartate carbamoyltransferase catalytic subunit [Psychrobacillus psychrodurans]SFM39511.1 aspartate carbamoyltransferase catalytic subunit [Psychrobacillus psychrodurans]